MTTYLYELPPSQICFPRFAPSFTLRVIFSLCVGNSGITPSLAGETYLLYVFDALTLN
jgi:hypothetical protein